jgi:Putative peptidoglycan binding domain
MIKNLLTTIGAVAAIGSISNAAFGKGGGNAAPPSVSASHHGASAPVAAPVGGAGVPHGYSGQHLSGSQHVTSGSYRPVTVYSNGHKVLVYPSVTGSAVVHHSTQSTANNSVSTGHLTQNGGANLQHKSRGDGNVAAKPRTLDPQTAARLRNWKGTVSSAGQAHQNNVNNHHHHHDHDWWRHHCFAFICWDWGWWAWDDGWWYPAWGYDPYSYYEYNQPIYGDFTPEQIVAGIQTELARRGYYTYAIDGKMGPLTRAALNRFQSDHHMNITSGIDPATLNALGVVR